MPTFKLNKFTSKQKDYDEATSEIKSLLANGKNCVARFYKFQPTDIVDDEIVLDAEYGSVADMFDNLTQPSVSLPIVWNRNTSEFNPLVAS